MTDHVTDNAAPKLLGGTATKLWIAGAGIAVLGLGAWLAPPRTNTLTTPNERPAPLLEEQVQQRAAVVPFSGLQDAVARLTPRGIEVRPRPAPVDGVGQDFGVPPRVERAGFGVAVDGSYAVTHRAAVNGAVSASVGDATGGSLAAAITAIDADTGLVLLRLESPVANVPALAAARLELGALVMGAATSGGRDLVIPAFVTTVAERHYRLSAGSSIPPGMPIFNLQGELAAVAGDDGYAWPVAVAMAALRGPQPLRASRSSIGVSYQSLEGPLETAFGSGGVVVVAATPGGPADRAGLRAGDVITAVNHQPVTNPSMLAGALAALPSGAAAPLVVRRGSVTTTRPVTPMAVDEVIALAGDRAADSAIDAAAVFPAQVLSAARVPSRSTIVTINGRPVASRAQAQREASRRPAGAVVLLEHQGTRFFALLEPAR